MILLCFFIAFFVISVATGLYYRRKDARYGYEGLDVEDIQIEVKGEEKSGDRKKMSCW